MRGVFAHDILSRTEIKSSCDSSVMIFVFIETNYNVSRTARNIRRARARVVAHPTLESVYYASHPSRVADVL